MVGGVSELGSAAANSIFIVPNSIKLWNPGRGGGGQ